MELWGQHGEWKSVKSQKNYMKRDPGAILSVSRATMTPVPAAILGALILTVAVPPVAIQSEAHTRAPAPPPPTPGSPEEGPRLMEGVPPGSFACQSSAQDRGTHSLLLPLGFSGAAPPSLCLSGARMCPRSHTNLAVGATEHEGLLVSWAQGPKT
jgi:hypothetical protein